MPTAAPKISLPKNWKESVKSSVLHVISLARYANTRAAAKAADDPGDAPAENARLRQRVAQLDEIMRLKDARMARIPGQRRPHYLPIERLEILELRSACGWSLEQTAREFLLTPATISSWVRRADEQGAKALVELPTPVNKFPDLVRYAVQRLKTLCPTLGKKKIAETLARAGVHLAVTTVGRILQEKPAKAPTTDQPDTTTAAAEQSAGNKQADRAKASEPKPRAIVAKRPNHVWHVDLTVVPTSVGFWCSWTPFAVLQCWPFCWWTAVIVDHFSRRIMGHATFVKQPTSEQVRAALGRAIHNAGAAPKYLICDKGAQFDNDAFRQWSQRRTGNKPRYGAVGKRGSIAVVERAILTIKTLLAMLPIVALSPAKFRHELDLLVEWYNEHRPHTTLRGQTPNDRYFHRFPANRRPRWEPRERWPRGSPCALPWAIVKGKPGVQLDLHVAYHGRRKHLPIVSLTKRAA